MPRLGYFVLIAVLAPLVAWNGLVQRINAAAYDLLLRLRSPAAGGAVRDCLLLAIDDSTAARYGPLPLPRATLAQALEVMAEAPPGVLVVDLLLSEPSPGDQRLAAALRRFPRVVAGAALTAEGPGWVLPAAAFRDLALPGHVHAAPDADGVVRSVLLAKSAAGTRLWAMGLQAARARLGAAQPVESSEGLSLAGIRIPAREAAARHMMVNFAGPEGAFERVPLAALLERRVAPERFRDRIVILGVTAQGGGDRLFTPVSSGMGMSGIEIHANVLRTILDGAFLVHAPPAGEFLAFLIIAGACVAMGRLRGLRLVGTAAVSVISLAAFCAAALRFGQVWPAGSLLAVFAVGMAVAVAGEYGLAVAAWRKSEARRRESAFRVQAIAHEIKTPLTAIQGSSELIAGEHVPQGEHAAIAGLIHKESKRLAEIVRTFVNVERMADIESRPVALDALCRDVLDRARLYAARKQISIEAQLIPIGMTGDPDLLSFAVYNLLTNAVKYSPKGSTVYLEVCRRGASIELSVRDRGYGIAAEEQPRIFERFYRGRKGPAAQEEGAGIGLALVKEIAERHGGTVRVESRPGAGSCFTLTLPGGAP